MTLVWLVVWSIDGNPGLGLNDDPNNWGIFLLICVALDLAFAQRT